MDPNSPFQPCGRDITNKGLTIRDYIAIEFAKAIMNRPEAASIQMQTIAEVAYKRADVLIAEGNKK